MEKRSIQTCFKMTEEELEELFYDAWEIPFPCALSKDGKHEFNMLVDQYGKVTIEVIDRTAKTYWEIRILGEDSEVRHCGMSPECCFTEWEKFV